ncbi:HAD family acid phosphatase [Streptomyces sp. 7N604]|uniref:HAD family acid phosphatase n=1 Tax=Streptomyces sp. 7N604 TaxID=3457415 RepID=UPI003FCF3F3A
MTARSVGRRVGVTVAVVVVSASAAATATAAPNGAAQLSRPPAVAADSGVDYDTWRRDVERVIAEARPYIEQRTENSQEEKQAIVLDIDNTSLESYFHPLPPTQAVAPVLELSKYAHSRGADIFFVTARPAILQPVTKYNLESAGYPVTGLYERGLIDLFAEVSAFKTEQRAAIEKQGYKIIANIGNNTSDLVGGHAERSFKLPDYGGKLS